MPTLTPTHVRLPDQYATNSDYRFRLELTESGEPWNLAGGSVDAFFRRPRNGGTVEKVCTAVDAAGGVFLARIVPGDLDDDGLWTLDVRVTKSDGDVDWWPYTITFKVNAKNE